MHLIVFSDTFENVNGVSTIYRDLLSWADGRDGLRVTIVTPSRRTRIEHGTHGNTSVHCIRPGIDLTPRAYPEFTTGLFRLKQVDCLLDTNDETVVHIATQGPYGILGQRFAKRHGIPSTGYYHTDFRRYLEIYGARMIPLIGKKLGTLSAWIMNALAYAGTVEMFVQSAEYIGEIGRFHRGAATVVPSGVNTGLFTPPDPSTARGGRLRDKYLGAHDHLAVFVGRVAAEKNLQAIMRHVAVFQERNIGVVFVGDGPFADEVRASSDIPVTGYLFKDDLADAYRSADLFLFPSLTDTYGMVLLEAMGTGLPIVCSTGTAPAAIVGNADAGVACDFSDSADIGRAIDRLMVPDAWAAFSANGIRFADENSLDHSLDTLIGRIRTHAVAINS